MDDRMFDLGTFNSGALSKMSAGNVMRFIEFLSENDGATIFELILKLESRKDVERCILDMLELGTIEIKDAVDDVHRFVLTTKGWAVASRISRIIDEIDSDPLV